MGSEPRCRVSPTIFVLLLVSSISFPAALSGVPLSFRSAVQRGLRSASVATSGAPRGPPAGLGVGGDAPRAVVFSRPLGGILKTSAFRGDHHQEAV